jgi:hypothetical protein
MRKLLLYHYIILIEEVPAMFVEEEDTSSRV